MLLVAQDPEAVVPVIVGAAGVSLSILTVNVPMPLPSPVSFGLELLTALAKI